MFTSIKALFTRTPGDASEAGQPVRKRKKAATIFLVFRIHVSARVLLRRRMPSCQRELLKAQLPGAIGCVSFPYVAVPAYWVFGKSKFDGYEMLRHSEQMANSTSAELAMQVLTDGGMLLETKSPLEASHQRLVEKISGLPITTGNTAKLLVDGEPDF